MSGQAAIRGANAELFGAEDSGSPVAMTNDKRMNEESFRLFYAATARSLLGYLWRVTGNRDLADDLLQESYCRLLSTDMPAMSPPETRSYLFRIATNLLHDHWRKQRRLTLAGFVQQLVHGASKEEIPAFPRMEADFEARTDLRSALAQLKPRDRQLLYLAYIEGFDHKEIADSTGLSTGSIRPLLFRARNRLAQLLRAKRR